MENGKTRLILDDDPTSTYRIDRYEPGTVWINKQPYTKSLLLGPHTLIEVFNHTDVSTLTYSDFENVLKANTDILLIGTGESLNFPEQALLEKFYLQGTGVECMTNRAACHTFTALASEQRQVMLCLIMPK